MLQRPIHEGRLYGKVSVSSSIIVLLLRHSATTPTLFSTTTQTNMLVTLQRNHHRLWSSGMWKAPCAHRTQKTPSMGEIDPSSNASTATEKSLVTDRAEHIADMCSSTLTDLSNANTAIHRMLYEANYTCC